MKELNVNMAKKKIAAKSTELDAKEFFAAISDIEKDKGIPKSYMLEKIAQALVTAYKRDHEGITDNVVVDANEEAETVRMFVKTCCASRSSLRTSGASPPRPPAR